MRNMSSFLCLEHFQRAFDPSDVGWIQRGTTVFTSKIVSYYQIINWLLSIIYGDPLNVYSAGRRLISK